ncbi:MAG: transglutaminase-like domain-containing protein [Candidatus Bathycorpusculaceae bacterium]
MLKRHKNQIALFLSLTIILFTSFSSFFSLQTTALGEDSAILKYEVTGVFAGNIRHVIQINNLASATIVGGRLFVPLLKNETSRHLVVIFNFSSADAKHELKILVDDFGNLYAVWNNLRIGGGQGFTVEISYNVVSFGVHYQINPNLMAEYNKSSSLYQAYTQPETLIESDSQEINSTAQNIVGDENNVHEKVSKIYNFVVGHIKYKAQEEEMGALWALRNGVGDCSEFSYLFVALCRAVGIPARVQAGFAFHRETAVVEDGHMWAEYYIENYGWVPVDATWRLSDMLDYLHFGSLRSISAVIPYSNFFFNYSSGPKEEFVKEEQLVSIKPLSKTTFKESFVEDIASSIGEINKAKNVMFLGEILGASTIFPLELSEAYQNLRESMILLQDAIEALERNPQLAWLNAAAALESAEKALNAGWMIIAKLLTIFIGVLTVVTVIAFAFIMKRYGMRLKGSRKAGSTNNNKKLG